MKKSILVIILILLLIVSGYFIVTRNKQSQQTNNDSSLTTGDNIKDVKADLNGDGNQETLRLTYIESAKETSSRASLVALDKNGNEIGPHSLPIPRPLDDSGKAITPDTKHKQQFVSFDFSVGPHSSETMFFGLQQHSNEVAPVCLTEDGKLPEDCLFWSGEIGELVVRDLDNDGFLEVVETVDEYPKSGTLTQDEEKAINETFKDLDKNVTDGMKRIAMREKGGRGNKVIWGIYKFNENFFEEQTDSNYDKYFALVNQYLKTTYPTYPTIMKRSTISKDSEDYNMFMRQFWTHR